MKSDDRKKTIASRLSIARKNAGLTQYQVAAMLKLHRPAISEIEAVRRNVSAEELVKFSEIYSVDFTAFNDDDILTLQLDETDLETAEKYFTKVTADRNLEGIVIRAHDGNPEVPFMKVRNENYLTLVYGPNFQYGYYYEKLVKKKNIKFKLKESEIEWRLGKKMLRCSAKNNTEKFLDTACLFFKEEKTAQSDKRL